MAAYIILTGILIVAIIDWRLKVMKRREQETAGVRLEEFNKEPSEEFKC